MKRELFSIGVIQPKRIDVRLCGYPAQATPDEIVEFELWASKNSVVMNYLMSESQIRREQYQGLAQDVDEAVIHFQSWRMNAMVAAQEWWKAYVLPKIEAEQAATERVE